jgi:hypothetical protein
MVEGEVAGSVVKGTEGEGGLQEREWDMLAGQLQYSGQ